MAMVMITGAEVADTATSPAEKAALMVMAMMTSQTKRTIAVRNRATPTETGTVQQHLGEPESDDVG